MASGENVLATRIESRLRANPLGYRLYERYGRGNRNNIIENPATWVSQNIPGGPQIMIGTKPMPQNVYKKIFYEPSSSVPRTAEDVLLYKGIHEFSHKAINHVYDIAAEGQCKDYMDLQSVLIEARHSGVGLTTFGSIDNKGQPMLQAAEDMVELMTMRIWSKQYFDDYLAFLANPQYEDYHSQMGLMTLDETSREVISQQIDQIILTSLE